MPSPLKFGARADDTDSMDFSQIVLTEAVEARIPASIEVHGLTELHGIANRDTLRFFASLPLAELRKRQSLTSQQQGMGYEQDQREKRTPLGGHTVGGAIQIIGFDNLHFRDKGYVQLAVTEDLLTQAVGLISFDDWVVPAQMSGYSVECS
jgi:hypothetical protein